MIYVEISQEWPDPCVYEESQRILNLCHTYKALGGARLAIQVELMASYVLEKILPQTDVIYLNLL